jgi:uncharacterized membrane protein
MVFGQSLEAALRSTAYALGVLAVFYVALLAILTIPFLQNQVIYLNSFLVPGYRHP